MKIKSSYVYILMNKRNTVLYIGVTNNIKRRIFEHKQKLQDGFTKKYNVTKLVYFEFFESIELAIKREKQLKGGSRGNKMNMILQFNPELKDLYTAID